MSEATQIARRKGIKEQAPDPIAALRRDPAFRAADSETQRWLLSLLEDGERVASVSETETAGDVPATK